MACTLSAPCGSMKRLIMIVENRLYWECLNAHTLIEGPPPPTLTGAQVAARNITEARHRSRASEHGRKAAQTRWKKAKHRKLAHA